MTINFIIFIIFLTIVIFTLNYFYNLEIIKNQKLFDEAQKLENQNVDR